MTLDAQDTEILQAKISDAITLRLTVTVTYEPNGMSEGELAAMLRNLPYDAASNGMMTYDSEAVVDEWSSTVERVG